MVQGSIERRVERLEDRLMPKEIRGPSPTKTVSEEWLKEFHGMLEEHYKNYGWRYESPRAKNKTA